MRAAPEMQIIDRLLAALLGLALLAAGVIASVEIVLGLLGHSSWIVPRDRWYVAVATSDWTATWVRTIASLACVIGAILVIVQLRPRRPAVLQVRSPEASLSVWVSRRSLERTLERAATGVDGIASAKVRLRADRAIVETVAQRRDTSGLGPRVEQVLGDQIRAIELQKQPRLSVSVRGRMPA
jgi:Family of unknown function (DUF6286)